MVARRSECDKEPSTRHVHSRLVSPPWKGFSRFIKSLLLLPLVLSFISCTAGTVNQLPTRGDRAQVEVYLQPVPAESGGLSWILEDLTAVRSDGIRLPLTLHANSIKGSNLQNRQILLGSGLLPPGSYSGFSLTISKASIAGTDGDAALLVPEEPVFIPGIFEPGISEVLPLFLKLDPAGIVTDGFEFTPAFSLARTTMELSSLTGYMTVPDADRVTVFNRRTLHVTGALATGRSPKALSLDPVLGRAYVAVSGENAVQVVDVLDGVISQRIPLRAGDKPEDLALTGDRQILLSANYGTNTLSILDPVQGVVMERIAVGRGPTSVVVNRSGTRAYVICSLSNSVSVVDLTTGTLISTLVLEEATPFAAALDRGEERLFVIYRDSPNLTVIDTSSLTFMDKVFVGLGSASIVVDDFSDLVFIGRTFGREISIIDPSPLMVVDTIRLEGEAGSMAIDSKDNSLFIVIPGKRVLQKIDLVSKRVLAEMNADPVPSEVAVFE